MPQTPVIAPLSHQAITQRVYNALKQSILSLELEPGTQLLERDLAARFQVSKSPVRDALQRLAGEGLVTQSDYHGMAVRVISLEEADEIYELREALEEMAVRLATPRLSREEIVDAAAHLDRAERAMNEGDCALAAEANRDFHAIFYRNCGNRPLHEMLVSLANRIQIVPLLSWHWRPASMKEQLVQHRSILDAVAERDAERASVLMRGHIRSFRRSYVKAREQAKANG
jgi:DNA-binding GntR family transcriptional regulator